MSVHSRHIIEKELSMKRILGLLFLLVSINSAAQVHMDVKLATNHLWRGIDSRTSVAIPVLIRYLNKRLEK